MIKTKIKTVAAAILAMLSAEKAGAQCISGYCVDGYGTYQTEETRYTGFFEDGIPNGHGIITWSSGDTYIGEFKNNKRTMQGSYYFADGYYLRGYFKDNLRHGPNDQFLPNGQKDKMESGVFDMDNLSKKTSGCIYGSDKDGFGVIWYDNGNIYEGYSKKGQYNGYGKLSLSDGSVYEGNFRNGKYHGYGMLTQPDTVLAGIWEEGKYNGALKNQKGCVSGDCENSYSVLVDETRKYFGDFKHGQPNGRGRIEYKNGDRYNGTISNGSMVGYGTYIYADSGEPDAKERYVGEFLNNQPHGYGAMIWKNGDIYYGKFANGLMQGQGIFEKKGSDNPEPGQYRAGTKLRDIDISEIEPIFGNSDEFGIILTKEGKYTGDLIDGVPNGHGMLECYNGMLIIGNFDEGKANGQCIAENSEGEWVSYKGSFANGKIQGHGSMEMRDGSIRRGQFRNGILSKEEVDLKVAKPQISWTEPQVISTQVKDGKAIVKLCVYSDAEISDVEIYCNDILKKKIISKGQSGKSSICDYSYACEIELEPGRNEIKAKVRNEGGASVSEPRYVTWEENDMLSSQKRVALIIGNADYANIGKLRNPANDAKLMDATLKQLGFECLTYTNITRDQMKQAVYAFGERIASEKAVGLFYYAGHGIQVDGVNYLVPVEALLDRKDDVEDVCFSIEKILGEMRYANNDLNIIVLDACRDDPFAKTTRAIKGDGGLAQLNAPKGTYIAYATSPGKTALDGTGNNGVYTEQLAKAMMVPGYKLEDVFKQVRNEVFRITNEQQIPWENSSVFGEFLFIR